MKQAKPILVLLVGVLLIAAACGGGSDDATEPSVASGLDDREWRTDYEDVVRGAFDAASRPQQRLNCREARRKTDDELIALFVSTSGAGTTNFEKLMVELEIVPTDEDLTYAAGLAVDVIRGRCAEEFPALAEPIPDDGESETDEESTPIPAVPTESESPDDY